MAAIARACTGGRIRADIGLVLCNRPEARVLALAAAQGLNHCCVDHRSFADRAAFEHEVMRRLRNARIDLVVLAGFMRILSEPFVREYCGFLLNIHPSLLPKYRGLDTHRRALEAGEREAGATVHFVVPELDAGPAILQGAVPVRADDTPDSLAMRVLETEHRIYPQAISWWAEGRLALRDGRAYLDGEEIVDASHGEARHEELRHGRRSGDSGQGIYGEASPDKGANPAANGKGGADPGSPCPRRDPGHRH